jgi:hypothetical protein
MAAGLGFKTFTTGEVLTSADVNGYLMQGILVFATEAARNSAITSPQEGQFAFTKDTNSLWYYTGSAWVASGATGDIEGVTAGTGISGGGTSGTVTITNSMATEIDAKGDLVVGTGADTFARLAVGTNGHTLVADSAEATGLKWAAPAGGGKVLQVVQVTYSTQTTIATQNYTDTGLSASITPSSASSKILVIAENNFEHSRGGSTSETAWKLLRGATLLVHQGTGNYNGYGTNLTGVTSQINYGNSVYHWLDSPNTTSSTTYKTQATVASTASSGQVVINNGTTSTMTLLEIGA